MFQSFSGKWRLGKICLIEAGGQGYAEEGSATH